MSSTRSRKKTPPPAACADAPAPATEAVDTSLLRTLVGYNARRASLSVIGLFMERMAVYGLKVVEFSVLSLVAHNPGITSRQLCATLNVLPPNMVGLIAALERRGLIERRPHPSDGRAMGVHLTPEGAALTAQAEQTAAQPDQRLALGGGQACGAAAGAFLSRPNSRTALSLRMPGITSGLKPAS